MGLVFRGGGDVGVRAVYIPPFAKCAKDGAPELLWLVEGDGSRFCANAHLSDDGIVAKMGHPDFVMG
jgi:hypothetical protein